MEGGAHVLDRDRLAHLARARVGSRVENLERSDRGLSCASHIWLTSSVDPGRQSACVSRCHCCGNTKIGCKLFPLTVAPHTWGTRATRGSRTHGWGAPKGEYPRKS